MTSDAERARHGAQSADSPVGSPSVLGPALALAETRLGGPDPTALTLVPTRELDALVASLPANLSARVWSQLSVLYGGPIYWMPAGYRRAARKKVLEEMLENKAALIALLKAELEKAATEDERETVAEKLYQWLQEDLKERMAPAESDDCPVDIAAFLMGLESVELHPYDDGAGNETIGVGHKLTEAEKASGSIVIKGQAVPYKGGISRRQAQDLLDQDLERFRRGVRDNVSVELNPCQFAALVSFAFNVGADAFKKSTLRRKLNQGHYEAVPGEMRKWIKANGKLNDGLRNRREREVELWERDPCCPPR